MVTDLKGDDVATDGQAADGATASRPYCHRFGQGPRPVLALHCSLAHGGAWRPLGAALADAVTLHAPDLPDHGRGPVTPPGHSLHDLATALAADLARDLGDGGPVDIIGHSFGATVALRLALEQPALVRRLALFEPVFFAAAIADNAPEVVAWQQDQQLLARLLAAGRQDEAARRFHAIWGGPQPFDQLPPHQRDYIAGRIGVIPAIGDIVVVDRAGLLAPGRLAGLTMPVLLAAGADSPPIIAAVNRALLARLPTTTHHAVIPTAGHMLPLTHPDAVAGLLRAAFDLPSASASALPPGAS